MKRTSHAYAGRIDGWMISTIGLIILVLGAGSLAIWSFLQYRDASTNLEVKVQAAEAEARRQQAEDDQARFDQVEKQPNREFAAPDDYGRVAFSYPKTWSVYVDKDAAKGGDYKAYLHPVVVPPVSDTTNKYALRLEILDKSYDDFVKSFERLISDGKLRSTTATIYGETGVRLDGDFSDTLRGSLVTFKMRDKTVVLRTDADTFKGDFDTLLKTITFVK